MQDMWSTSCPMPVHINDTYVETQVWSPSTVDTQTCCGNQLKMPCNMAAVSPPPVVDCTESQTLAGAPAKIQKKYSPGALFVRSATLVDHEDGSECSTTDTMGTVSPMYELPNQEPAQSFTDSMSATMFLQSHMAHTTPSEPYGLTPAQIPTMGSMAHFSGQCKPCAFVGTKGCMSGYNCQFCHLCPPGEKKRRKREAAIYYTRLQRTVWWSGAGTEMLA